MLLLEAYSVSATAFLDFKDIFLHIDFSNKLSESMIMKYKITHYRLFIAVCRL